MKIAILSVATCNACQNTCEHCAHQGIRDDDPGYHMPLEQLAELLDHFARRGIRAGLLSFCGPGEPLLWRHFNEGVRMAARSGVADRVEITTNAKALDRIEEDVWPLLNPVYVSQYEDMPRLPKRPNIVVRDKTEFAALDEARLPVNMVRPCACPGATFYKGRVYPHCGPVVFDALRRSGRTVADCSVPLADYDPAAVPVLSLPCRWCWGNPDAPKDLVRHAQKERT